MSEPLATQRTLPARPHRPRTSAFGPRALSNVMSQPDVAQPLRQQALDLHSQAKALGQQATAAFAAGRKAEAHELSTASKSMHVRAEQLDAQAADLVFAAHNPPDEPNAIDLHGLYAKEALQRLERVPWPEARVIVGKGMHSKDGVPVLKPAVLKFCQERGLGVEPDSTNDGVLVVRGLDRLAGYPSPPPETTGSQNQSYQPYQSGQQQPYAGPNQPYAPQQYGGQPYAPQQYGNQPYAPQQYGNQPYAPQQYGGQPYGAQSYAPQNYSGYGGQPSTYVQASATGTEYRCGCCRLFCFG